MIFKIKLGRVGQQRKYRVAGRVWVPAGHCICYRILDLEFTILPTLDRCQCWERCSTRASSHAISTATFNTGDRHVELRFESNILKTRQFIKIQQCKKCNVSLPFSFSSFPTYKKNPFRSTKTKKGFLFRPTLTSIRIWDMVVSFVGVIFKQKNRNM